MSEQSAMHEASAERAEVIAPRSIVARASPPPAFCTRPMVPPRRSVKRTTPACSRSASASTK
eukprot:scaffold203059_cov32-Tisochrysis_lutea.AAC.5